MISANRMYRISFREIRGVYVPARSAEDRPHWCSAEDCLLEAPIDLSNKLPIDSMYQEAFGSTGMDLSSITNFFRSSLGMHLCSWRDHVHELRFLRDRHCTDIERIKAQYRRL